jgi:hypothetical protein
MSSTKKDRTFRSNSNKTFRADRLGSGAFAQAVSAALRDEFGTRPGGVKTVARLVGANERAVKNWFDAKNAPSGELLVMLCRNSEHVLETVLRLAGKAELIQVKKLSHIRDVMRQMLTMFDDLDREMNSGEHS